MSDDDLVKRIEQLEAKLAAADSLESQLKSRMSHAMLDATWHFRKLLIGFGVAAGIVVAASAGLSVVSLLRSRPAHVQDNVRSRRFELLDRNGKARVVLEDDAKDGPQLALLDPEGRKRGVLRVGEKGQARLGLVSAAGQEQVSLTLNEEGEPCLNLSDRNGRPRIGMIVEQKVADRSYMLQSDEKGNIQWKAP